MNVVFLKGISGIAKFLEFRRRFHKLKILFLK